MWALFRRLELDKKIDVALRVSSPRANEPKMEILLNVGTEQRQNFFSQIGETVH
jgi:hypothetical protein